jgi:predicted RNase H-like HicB family nuclease
MIKTIKRINMKKVVVVIEKASDGGYGIHCPDLKGIALYGYGLTEKEAKENLVENLDAILEHYEEEKLPAPEVLQGKIEFDYRYDTSGCFIDYKNRGELLVNSST